MHIEKITIEGIPPIWNSIELDCDERVNLFIGPNASGKSTILRVIDYVFFPRDHHPITETLGPAGNTEYIHAGRDVIALPNSKLQISQLLDDFDKEPPYCQIRLCDKGRQVEIFVGKEAEANVEKTTSRAPLLYIPATRVSLSLNPTPSKLDQMLALSLEQMKVILEASRLLGAGSEFKSVEVQSLLKRSYEISGRVRKDYLGILFDTSDGVFYGHNVKSAVDANRGLRTAGHFAQHYRHGYERAIQLGYSCAKSICPEVIHDDAPHPYLEVQEFASSQDDLIVHPNMAVGTSDAFNEVPLYLGALSSGTQGTLLWIYALALKMAQHYDWEEGWEKEPAILLIDEIENHLHPTWQRRVIPALLEQFPKLQIFATTHSPFVVAGLKAGQVHLLSRGEGGEVTAATNNEDVVGWTMDEVLRNIMGVTDPTDDETARAAEELRRLRNQEPQTDGQEEERRQQRMRELRQRVNRELLAGGPEAADREEFEQQFAEALQRYQESHSLDQDSG